MRLATLLSIGLFAGVLHAQTTVTVTTGPANSEQTWYSLANGVVGSAPLAEWDLAFEIQGFTASILANGAKGIVLYKAPYAIGDWALVDTNGMSTTWTTSYNSDGDWSSGAFNQGLTTDEFDLGWGVYNMITHSVVGDSLFVIKLANGTFKKIRIDALATGSYTFTWADVDGANEQTASLDKAAYADKNFAYYSLENSAALDREPVNTTWDLLFTKYTTFIPTPYGVSGVLSNKYITSLRVDGLDPSLADWTSAPFDTVINTIGYDWKTFNMQTFQYEYDQDLTFFVQDQAGSIWKLLFTEYGGTATGDMTFTQELVSALAVDDRTSNGQVVVVPNPATDAVNVLFDIPPTDAVLTMYDITGNLVRNERFAGLAPMSTRVIDISGLGAGIYSLRVEHAHGAVTSRLVVR
ncbi:MAG: T9SS type A sorting domain-containing protein [Flavobacteriales bacterium]|nr:T9SS type A sorting domain-containing protein [Flavobacteriales bacterium]